ncbi:MAG: hypothetical protein HY737_08160 [Candidatus Omnitrophica bacterium]|nr:hypothetical protein [Candidatus Omnitrophota bacterium]
MAQLLLVQVLPSPWWVPDLLVVALVVAMSAQPNRWVALSAAAGLCQSVWAVRFPWHIVMSYVGVGWLAMLAHARWNAADWRVQALAVGAGVAMVTAVGLGLDALWSLDAIGLAGVRVGLTVLSFFLLRRIADSSLG